MTRPEHYTRLISFRVLFMVSRKIAENNLSGKRERVRRGLAESCAHFSMSTNCRTPHETKRNQSAITIVKARRQKRNARNLSHGKLTSSFRQSIRSQNSRSRKRNFPGTDLTLVKKVLTCDEWVGGHKGNRCEAGCRCVVLK